NLTVYCEPAEPLSGVDVSGNERATAIDRQAWACRPDWCCRSRRASQRLAACHVHIFCFCRLLFTSTRRTFGLLFRCRGDHLAGLLPFPHRFPIPRDLRLRITAKRLANSVTLQSKALP